MEISLSYSRRSSSIGESEKLLVLLHGLGSSDKDLFSLAQFIPENYAFYCLRAPFEYFGGYKWFSLDIGSSEIRFDASEALASLSLIKTTLSNIQTELDISARNTILGGFSQGAIMTSGILLTDSSVCQSAWLMSGATVQGLGGEVFARYEDAPRVLIQHGQFDSVIPIAAGRDSETILKAEIRAEVTFKEYPIYHSLSQESIDEAVDWMKGL